MPRFRPTSFTILALLAVTGCTGTAGPTTEPSTATTITPAPSAPASAAPSASPAPTLSPTPTPLPTPTPTPGPPDPSGELVELWQGITVHVPAGWTFVGLEPSDDTKRSFNFTHTATGTKSFLDINVWRMKHSPGAVCGTYNRQLLPKFPGATEVVASALPFSSPHGGGTQVVCGFTNGRSSQTGDLVTGQIWVISKDVTVVPHVVFVHRFIEEHADGRPQPEEAVSQQVVADLSAMSQEVGHQVMAFG